MLSANPWAIDQAPLPVDLSRQEYWYRLPLSPPGYFSTQRSNPCLLGLLHWQADALLLSHLGIACYGLALSKKMGLRIKARSSVNLTVEHKSQTQVSTHWEHSDHRKSRNGSEKPWLMRGTTWEGPEGAIWVPGMSWSFTWMVIIQLFTA